MRGHFRGLQELQEISLQPSWGYSPHNKMPDIRREPLASLVFNRFHFVEPADLIMTKV